MKLSEAYHKYIGNKEKNKRIIDERIDMMKNKKRKYFYNVAFAVTAMIAIFAGYFYYNQNSNLNKNKIETITIEGKEYYNYYGIGANMNKVPTSPIYAYAIRQDQESYKIVSLHKDGTNFDLIAVNDLIEDVSSDGSALEPYYKLAIVDNKLYFIRLAYYNSKTIGEDNSNVKEGKNQEYDIEVYYININNEHPKLELMLQEGDGPGVYYDVNYVMINDGYLYYSGFDSREIKVLALGDNPKRENIVLYKPILSYFIKNNTFYAVTASVNSNDYIEFDPVHKAENNNSVLRTVTQYAYSKSYNLEDIWTTNNLIHYYNYTNSYTELWSNNTKVKLEGFISSEKGVGFVGNKFNVNGQTIFEYESTDTYGLNLLSADEENVYYCLGEEKKCDKYYSYNIESHQSQLEDDATNYFLLIYNDNDILNDKKLTYALSGDKLTNGESKVLGNIQMNEKSYVVSYTLNQFEDSPFATVKLKIGDKEFELISAILYLLPNAVIISETEDCGYIKSMIILDENLNVIFQANDLLYGSDDITKELIDYIEKKITYYQSINDSTVAEYQIDFINNIIGEPHIVGTHDADNFICVK